MEQIYYIPEGLSTTMQEFLANSLLDAISESRLEPYLTPAGRVSIQAGIARYLWNIRLSESLYPALQGVEVTLRNSIHRAVAENFGNRGWLDSLLVDPETKCLENARTKLRAQNKTPHADNLMPELNFGFWVGLFNNRYEGILWPLLLRAVFPYMPRRLRTQGYAFRRLRRIRNLRNRVFHHEPIWYWHDLEQNHRNILEVIGWINPELLALVQLLDRFPEVYAQGPERYFEELRRWGGGNA